ncbi:DNA methyltransferase [Paucibacter soli]|uniref:DNA methyltransferase n=1 Tax=Paucibacter soli TaxID=3133433 RepID=UPI00309832B0
MFDSLKDLGGDSAPKIPKLPDGGGLAASMLQAYMSSDTLSNNALYEQLIENGLLDRAAVEAKAPVGKDGVHFSLAKRRVRWWQQHLKQHGIIERIPSERGTWRLSDRNKKDMTKAPPKTVMIGFSTELGVALWGACNDVFGSMTESIAVAITSPPYPLANPRAYGNPSQEEWVDFVCRSLEPIVKRLLPGGTIAVNLSNDVFEPGSPARSLYRAKFEIAMYERLGMSLLDQVIWENPSKPPGPFQWASKRRMQLNVGYEPILVFCNDPLKCFADNRRVLQPHTETHKKLIERGGEQRARSNSDGSYRVYQGSYGNETAGRIPKNVLRYGHSCADQRSMRKMAKAAGLPVHGASMPLALAIFLVKWLSRPGDLIVDPFGGTQTTAKAAELLGRLWATSEIYAEYVWNGKFRFSSQMVE